MGRPERPIDPEAGPLQRFAYELRQLRKAAGLDYRHLGRQAHYSSTTLSEAAGGEKLPSLEVALAYAEACGGDRQAWKADWEAVAAKLAPPPEETAEAETQAGDVAIAGGVFPREPVVDDGGALGARLPTPESRLGAALRSARESRGLSLRALARRLRRSHSNLVEYERGHRLAPLEIVQAYEKELQVTRGTLVGLYERVHFELYGEDRSHRPPHALESSSDPGIRHLPADIPGFTGREAELARLRAAMVDSTADSAPLGIWIVAGMAGVGKTALAVHLAHELAPEFPDAQLHLDLHGYEPRQRLSPAQALDRLLRVLGVTPEALPTDVDVQAALYRGLLSDKRSLVILDNASSADQVRPLLPGGRSSLVLVTSRDRLLGLVAGEGAHLLSLEVLSPEETVELLAKVIGHHRVSTEPEAVVAVARRCGYLPLAVRIVAARVAARPTMSIAETAERLADEQHRLDELKAGDRQVRASLALSYEDLSPIAARMFRRLGLVAGPDFSAGVAAALLDTSLREAAVLLDELLDAHLLEPTPMPGRFRFHDLLRLYARERVRTEEDDQEREGALRRMLTWYLDAARAADRIPAPGRHLLPGLETGGWTEAAFCTHAQALAWFEAERANLVAATHQAADCGLYAFAWLIPNALFGFFDLRSQWGDWQDTHEVGLAAARVARDRQAEAWTLGGLGTAYGDLRRFQEAADCQEQALVIARQIGDRWCEAVALGSLGVMYGALGRPDEAVDCYQQALPIVREVGYRRAEAMNLLRLGESRRGLRDFAEAIDYGHQALAIFRELGDGYHEGMVLTNIGNACREVGRAEEAIDALEAAARLHRDTGSRWGEGEALQFLGLALQCDQRMDEARACWQKALRIFTDLGAPDAEDVQAFLGE
jgi:tetratricopeptide (TPR) repeat protein